MSESQSERTLLEIAREPGVANGCGNTGCGDSEIDRVAVLPVSRGGSRRPAADGIRGRTGDARIPLQSLAAFPPRARPFPIPAFLDQHMPIWITT